MYGRTACVGELSLSHSSIQSLKHHKSLFYNVLVKKNGHCNHVITRKIDICRSLANCFLETKRRMKGDFSGEEFYGCENCLCPTLPFKAFNIIKFIL